MIGIIGAMNIEVDILKSCMKDAVSAAVSGIDFIVGELFGKEAVVAKCGIGKVNAALCTEAMIMRFSPELIINTGIAGSLTKELSTLDVAIAHSVVQHDFDISYFGHKKGYFPDLGLIEFPADPAISRAVEGIVRGMGVRCGLGVIASGDQFICDEEIKDAISTEFSAIACEMEGAAIGHVCHRNKVPFAVIRAISDSADGANMDYETFSEKAARLSAKIVENFIMSL